MRSGALFSAGTWPLVAAGVSAAMLAAAHAFEAAGYDPCPLCLMQREIYWMALTLGLGGWAAARLARDRRLAPVLCALLALVFLVGAGVAAFHAGVEWKWWPGLPACSAASTGPVSLGRARLRAGANELTLELVGKDPRAQGYSEGYLVGIDGFELRPAPAASPR